VQRERIRFGCNRSRVNIPARVFMFDYFALLMCFTFFCPKHIICHKMLLLMLANSVCISDFISLRKAITSESFVLLARTRVVLWYRVMVAFLRRAPRQTIINVVSVVWVALNTFYSNAGKSYTNLHFAKI